MQITESLSRELASNREFACKVNAAESVLKSESNSVAIVYGRSDVVRDSFDGIDALYTFSPIPFVARKTTEGIVFEAGE